MKNHTKGEAMDPAARERVTPEPPPMSARNCYAAQTLAAEVAATFPSSIGEPGYDNRNGRGVALDIMWLDEDPDLYPLLSLVQSDPRVEEVISEEGQVLVAFVNNPATYDSRDPFGLSEAKSVLDEGGDIVLDDAGDFAVQRATEVVNDGVETGEDDGHGEDAGDDVVAVDEDEEPDEEQYVYRSAKTGRIVTEKYALANPDTTVRESVED